MVGQNQNGTNKGNRVRARGARTINTINTYLFISVCLSVVHALNTIYSRVAAYMFGFTVYVHLEPDEGAATAAAATATVSLMAQTMC